MCSPPCNKKLLVLSQLFSEVCRHVAWVWPTWGKGCCWGNVSQGAMEKCVRARGAGCKGYSEPRRFLLLPKAWLCMPLPACSLPRHLTWKEKKVLHWQCPKKENALNLVARKSGQAEAEASSNSGKLVIDKSQCLRQCCWDKELGRTQDHIHWQQGWTDLETGVGNKAFCIQPQIFLSRIELTSVVVPERVFIIMCGQGWCFWLYCTSLANQFGNIRGILCGNLQVKESLYK